MKTRVHLHLSAFYFALILLLAACGGERLTPTPVPASIVRPVQPTPVYGKSSEFTLATPQSITSTGVPSVQVSQIAPVTTTQSIVALETLPSLDLSTLQQPPSALGIATGDAVLLDRPDGRALVNLPGGATVTITGKSADNRYLAAYTNDGVLGWVPAGQLLLLGADDLTVVQTTSGPGLIATLIAQAMQPLTTTVATPVPVLSATIAVTTATDLGIGAIISEDRVNVRDAPDVNAMVIAKLNQGDSVQILGKNDVGDWLQVRATTGAEGWVSAQFVKVSDVAQP